MEALTRAEADVAFLWGPAAGYFNKNRLGGAYAIVPIAGEAFSGKRPSGEKGQDSLKADLDRILDQLKPEITRSRTNTAFPRTTRQPRRSARNAAAIRARRGRTPARAASGRYDTPDAVCRRVVLHGRRPHSARTQPVQPALLALPRAQRHEPRADSRLAPVGAPLRFQGCARWPTRRSRSGESTKGCQPGGTSWVKRRSRTSSDSWSPSSASRKNAGSMGRSSRALLTRGCWRRLVGNA